MKKFIFLTSFALTACTGYQPLYQQTKALPGVVVGSVEMAQIEYNPGERRVAQKVAQQLNRFFKGGSANDLTLNISIHETINELAVRRDATVERSQVNLQASITLLDIEGKSVFNTKLTSTSAYNVEDTPYSTEAGKVFARESAANTLTDKIAERVQYFLRFQQINK